MNMSYHLTNIQLFLCEIGKGRGISPWVSEENERKIFPVDIGYGLLVIPIPKIKVKMGKALTCKDEYRK